MIRRRPTDVHVCSSSSGRNANKNPRHRIERFADDIERRNDAVECGALADADDVEQRQTDDQPERHARNAPKGASDPVSTGTSWLR